MARKKILVTEDEKNILDSLKEILGDDYDVITATNGAEGVKAAEAHKPDLILLDVMMPVMDGMSACKRIKANKDTAHIPVIFLTAKGQVYDMEEGIKAGAYAYMIKPFSPARLLAKIEEVFEKIETRKKMK